jgi:hypothetical protein
MTILPPHEDVFKILEESQPSDVPKNKPLILTVQNKSKNKDTKGSGKEEEIKPKPDPIEQEINDLLLSYLMQIKRNKGVKPPRNGFREYVEKYASSSQVIERLSFKDAACEKEKAEKGNIAKNSKNKNDKNLTLE